MILGKYQKICDTRNKISMLHTTWARGSDLTSRLPFLNAMDCEKLCAVIDIDSATLPFAWLNELPDILEEKKPDIISV